MRISTLLLFLGILSVSASTYSQEAKVTIQVNNQSISEVFSEIKTQTNYSFWFDLKEVDINRTVSINAENETVKNVLSTVLKGQQLDFELKGNHIIIYRPDNNNKITPSYSGPQQNVRTVTGTVIDQYGQPIIGANVFIKGTTNGVVSDFDGKFSIQVEPNATLTVSYIGFHSQEVQTGNKTNLSILLEENLTVLDEIVVVGYGTVKKRDLTGAISSINSTKISEVPVTSAAQALQGRIAGALVTNSSSTPGSEASVLIRGKRSFKASNDPLYVVDGIPMTATLNEISPADIESIDVLKDASATAIYGARGANGVIMITTKKGKQGKIQVDYSGYVGAQTVLNEVEFMNGAEYAEYVRESYRATGVYTSDVPNKILDYQKVPSFGGRSNGDIVNFSDPADKYTWESIARAYDTNGNYDPSKVRSDSEWWDKVKRTGMVTDHQVSIRGGSEKAQYLGSATYHKNNGIFKNQDYERFSIRFNLDLQISNALKIGGQTQFSQSTQNRGINYTGNNWRVMPIGRFYDDNGELLKMVSGADNQWWNPLQDLVDGAVVRPVKNNRYIGSYYAELKLPVDGLRFRSNVGIDFRSTQNYEFLASNTTARQGKTNSAFNNTEDQFMYTWENLLFYDKEIGNHTIGATALQSIQRKTLNNNGIPVENIPYDALVYYDVGSALTPGNISSYHQTWSLASFMGRVNYGFKNRYLLTASLRYDGSSRLADGHKWVLFPAVSAAWRLNEESFLQDFQNLDNLKIRVGVGTTANAAIDPYQTKGPLSKKYYNFGSDKVIGYAPGTLPNKTLTWETTQQWNLGLDFGFFKGRINGTLEFYLSNTHDLLLDRQLPVVSGYENVLSNVGKTRNKGIEMSLNTLNIDSKDFRWTTDWMFYINKEEIVELYNGKVDDVGNNWFIGEPINVFFGYKKVGIWQNTEADLAEIKKFNANGMNFAPGTIRLYDDGDYKITESDRVILGKSRPDFILSLINSFHYKNVDLSVFLYGSFGAMLNNNMEYMVQAYRNNNIKVDYWTPSNPTNKFPRPNANKNADYMSTLYFENADFLRVKTITLGYTFPRKLLSKANIQQCRIYATAQNPLLWTNYSGVDPEGATGYAAPSVRSWILGLNISF